MKDIPTIKIDMDKKCSRCGEEGAAPNGLCLKCVAKDIGKFRIGGSMEVKVIIKGAEELKTNTFLKPIKQDGEIIGHKFVTKVQFETEIEPGELALIHQLLRNDETVYAVIGSRQAVMDFDVTKVDVTTGEVS